MDDNEDKPDNKTDSGIKNGLAGAIVGALGAIIAALIGYCAIQGCGNDDPAPPPPPKKVSYIITIKTADIKKAGTDSDIRIDFNKGSALVSTLIFDGGSGDDVILEQGTISPASFKNQIILDVDSVTLTLLKPTGNGGHWYGEYFKVHVPEQNITMCSAGGQIGWLKAGNPSKKLNLVNC